MSRARLLELFPVHETVASRDLSAFRRAYPKACDSRHAGKWFDVGPLFKPTLTEGVFAEYQALIGAGGEQEELAAGVPAIAVKPDVTVIGYRPFRQIHAAIRGGRCVRITYRSMSTPEPHERIIFPHTLIKASPRWHVRAWCEKAQAFRDFNLGRISAAVPASYPADWGPDKDEAWKQEVKVRLVPHEALSPERKRLVRDEFMGGTTALVHTVRVPLVRYLIRAFGAAVNPILERPPAHLLMVESPEALPDGALAD